MTQTTRRGFAQTIAGACCAAVLHGQAAEPWAGDRIVDCHHHIRPTPEANIAHLDGVGISNALGLARERFGGAGQAVADAVSGTLPGMVRRHGHHASRRRSNCSPGGEEAARSVSAS